MDQKPASFILLHILTIDLLHFLWFLRRMRIGIYPGTFDPVTKGHLHIIKRASKLVDHLIVAVAPNAKKAPFFDQRERVNMVQEDIDNLHDKACPIVVEAFDGLLIKYAKEKEAACIFRGLRAVSDFEFEFQMTGMNAKLDPEIETVFLMASDKWQFVSSSFIKEIGALGGKIEDFVTPQVAAKLLDKYAKNP
ncbi:MAG: pantetheine-phosphate adenylyltransferase [Alphaproteobacteria bacterium]|nr:pantetheine-phosphate adenylyltransferase [Alphaproteobacteria bacterium]